MKTPRISIIMNCYNGERYLREAIDSIYAQTYQDWEIIFWDNLSVDASASIAQSYDGRLRYFRGEKNVPLGSARNLALREVTAPYIGFLDVDDQWLPEKLALQVAMLDANPALGLVHGDSEILDERTGKTTLFFRNLGHRPQRGHIFPYLLRNNAICMPTVVLRKEVLAGLDHWFDERFEIYPDFDLFRRIAYQWQCDYVDAPVAIYRVHPASSSFRLHQKAATELAITLEKFTARFPEFTTQYAAEVDYLRAMVAYQRGKSLWREGDGRGARREFSGHLHLPMMKTAYAASLIPFSTAERLRHWLQVITQAVRR